ncbi:MAG TPA: Gfo/Idh/MocA family oxidoreductase [Clostridiales bacterium]|jgi:predicted dehydrogenase|nr:Gfo/Idh/MocA family oxidoreductase [Clostridiales bacterium]
MSQLVRYGMVGGDEGAFIGKVHRRAIGFDERIQLVAGCFSASSQEKNKKTGQVLRLDPARVYDTYQDMAREEGKREDGIDFVSIVTPNVTHFDIAKTFLENGIHVMCEKPLTFTVEQAEELAHLAQQKNLLFGVNYSYTGYVLAKVMREMVAEGKIGKVISVNAEYPQEWLLDDLHPVEGQELSLSVWRKNPEIAGISNCVGDIGSHIENFVHYITGLKIKRLLATVNRFGQPLDLNANILVEYDNGANGAYWCSQVAAGTLNALAVRIYGDEGSLEWQQENPDYVRYTPRGEAPRTLTRGNGYLKEKAAAFSQLPTGHPEGLHVAFGNLYQQFASAVIAHREGQPTDGFDFPRVQDGVNGVKFIHAVINSAKNDSAWVHIN